MRRQNQNSLLLDQDCSASDNTEFQLFLKLAHDFAPVLGVDTESNGEDLRDGRGFAMGMSVAFKFDGTNGYSYYFPFRHPDSGNLRWDYRDQLKKLIESKSITCHHLRHDILALKSLGIEAGPDPRCSLLAAHNVREDQLSFGLDYQARNVLGIPGKMRDDDFENIKKAFGWGSIPSYAMADYGAQDAILHLAVHDYYWPQFIAEEPDNAERWKVELEFAKLLNKIEGTGVLVDLDLATQQTTLGELRMTELMDELGYNPGSRNDLEKLLIGDLKLPIFRGQRSDKGNLSFAKRFMEQYEEILLYSPQYQNSPVAGNILEYRGYQKAVSSYWKAYTRLVSPDGRLRPNFKQHGTKNSRLSCEDPNLQQIPKVTAKPWNRRVKAGFLARSGYKLWEADYAQLEKRIQAAYSKEPLLVEVFNDDSRDLFTEMGIELGYPRDVIKPFNYAIDYGARPAKVAMMLGIPEWKAERLHSSYFARFTKLADLSERATRLAKERGYVQYWTNRRRHFENPQAEAHKALNSVLQGGAAEIVKRAMLRLDNELDPECLMELQVHDSVWFEIPEGTEKKHLPEIKRIMEAVPEDFGIPFKVDIHEVGQ